MWDNTRVDISQEDGCVFYLLQNPSKTDTASYPGGMGVARLTAHASVEDMLDHSGWQAPHMDQDFIDKKECCAMPSSVNLIVTQPLDLTKNNHKVEELPPDHLLRGTATDLEEETEANLATMEGKKQYETWTKEIASQFQWGQEATDDIKQLFNRVLYQFRDVFSANPKAPTPIKGVECALYFKEQHPYRSGDRLLG